MKLKNNEEIRFATDNFDVRQHAWAEGLVLLNVLKNS